MPAQPIHYKILFACSELTPLVKTGGLADVCGSLPQALSRTGDDVRIVIPGYKSVLHQIENPVFECIIDLPLGPVTICSTSHTDKQLLLVCHPLLSNRDGNPYMSDDDKEWPDNPLRFALFSQAVAAIALDQNNLGWCPEIVHCHDWQTGLVPALLSQHKARPATLFTIHNLAYQGNIPQSHYNELNLPPSLFHPDGLEFWGQASYIKGGLAFADRINTVSPGYAEEIKTVKFGNGMDGMLRSRADRLSGILNGIDDDSWNPLSDHQLVKNYGPESLDDKLTNKSALQKETGLPVDADALLLGVISRLAEQKGIDLIIDAINSSIKENIQLVVLGSGETNLQSRLLALQKNHNHKVAIRLGFDEKLSRLIEAGSDVFLMPSRYEPCGLNQMYSLRYGTLPIVTNVGGLADTVLNYDNNEDLANGFVINNATVKDLKDGIKRALDIFDDKKLWRKLQLNGMSTSFSWAQSAVRYRSLYAKALADSTSANQTKTTDSQT